MERRKEKFVPQRRLRLPAAPSCQPTPPHAVPQLRSGPVDSPVCSGPAAGAMCERPKIHVFLGAPSPSSAPPSVPEAGMEGEDRAPDGWTQLELTWREGRLRLATEEPAEEARSSRAEGEEAEPPNRAEEESNAEEEESNAEEEESNAEEEDRCSASVQEYLDSCFPAAQPEPEPEPEPGPGPNQQQPPAAPLLSPRTHYLSTWTLSQALILKSRYGVQSAASPEKTKPAQTPPSVCSSTPELFSPAPPSPGASAELFSHACPSPRAEEGGVVLQKAEEGGVVLQKAEEGGVVLQRAEEGGVVLQRAEEGGVVLQRAEEGGVVLQRAEEGGVVLQKAEEGGVVLQRAEEGGVVLQATTDGVLCSQETTPGHHPPTEPPISKRARLSEDSRTTPLSRCDRAGLRCSVLVVVVHPCHLKEVKVKSGPSAGTSVPLASIVVLDQSNGEMKVVLWRRAAFWALTVSPGDILLITGLQVSEDRWRGETVLQSTFSSKLLNLGHASTSPVTHHVNARSLSTLCSFVRERRPLLASLPHRCPQNLSRLPYANLRALQVNSLVHALLRVTHAHISPEWRSEAESRSRSAVQMKAVLSVEQPDDQQGALLLWGAAVDWLPSFNTDRSTVWDFQVLLVREGLTSDLPELHSTPWSSFRALDPTDRRALDFSRTLRRPRGGGGAVELDVETLLSQKYSGEVELTVQVLSFHFQDAPPSQNAPVLDGSTPLDGIVATLSGDITYTGCGRCSAELETDANGIYGPCYPCLPHTAARRFYRPGVLTVSGRGCAHLSVQVPPVPLQKILHAAPDRLQRSSAPGSQVKLIQVAAERLHALLSLPRETFIITVRSCFLCDENSVPIGQDFTLLDLRFPAAVRQPLCGRS
ncbi:shieldin complex subunit 2 isoform 2-T2 [Odontesthes bonariensis]|uniref:shieldin complex subunit 2 isoform X2 n=1 Tax=Odontesthes bonariensis TaxID=219752 RepID=UPI003F58E6E7